MKKYYGIPLMVLWAVITCCAWFGPAKDLSQSERRPLAQMPEMTPASVLSGKYMEKFEDASLDQFPLRDGFRRVKSLFHFHVLGQKDNNGIYLSDGYAVKQEYPLNETSLDHALERFGFLHDTYLRNCKVYAAVIPDKGYYLGGGNLTMDYEKLFETLRAGMPWAEHIDLTDTLSASDYYRTDTHWRQENLLPAAEKIAGAMGVTALKDGVPTLMDQPFYGVYYGQAALPMEPDELYLMESETLESCTVTDYETGKTGPVYDREKLAGKDPYEVFLSGPKSLLTIENPGAATQRELIVFRDSFGSSLIPLLVPDYAKITLVDIRYIQSSALGYFVDFQDQDVLFLYSTLVLNNGNTMK